MARLPQADPGLYSSPTPLSAPFIAGLENARWPGRCQQVVDPIRDGSARKGRTTWYLDGAHTVESLKACAEWYASPNVSLPAEDQKDQPYVLSSIIQWTERPWSDGSPSSNVKRALIFNCTSGRSGMSFVTTLLENIAAQLEKHGYTSLVVGHPGFFDAAIFCTNVTYADGNFKGGESGYYG